MPTIPRTTKEDSPKCILCFLYVEEIWAGREIQDYLPNRRFPHHITDYNVHLNKGEDPALRLTHQASIHIQTRLSRRSYEVCECRLSRHCGPFTSSPTIGEKRGMACLMLLR